jgi:hypothetical protein
MSLKNMQTVMYISIIYQVMCHHLLLLLLYMLIYTFLFFLKSAHLAVGAYLVCMMCTLNLNHSSKIQGLIFFHAIEGGVVGGRNYKRT